MTKQTPPLPKVRRLFWDIETSPNIGFFWRAGHKQFVNYDSIVTERAIICICYKWEGDSTVHELHWNNEKSDRELLRRFLREANQADELIAHNGDQFDMPWFRTRCLFHGLPTLPAYKTADTLQWAKRNFYFNSNRMDYIAKFLGFGGKIQTDLGLWKDVVLNNDRGALRRMIDYCKRDVELLERVWEKLSRVVKHKTHAGVVAGRDKWTCPRCASEKVKKNLTRVTAEGYTQHQMKCKCCGASYSISSPVFKAYQEAKKRP